MLLLLKLLIWTVRALARSRQALLLDNLALRQQLATLVHRSGLWLAKIPSGLLKRLRATHSGGAGRRHGAVRRPSRAAQRL
jgi:hypothetical protein